MKKAKLTWVVAGSMFAALCLNASHAAGEGRSAASAELVSLGFRPWSMLFSGGTVSELLSGDANLQINASHAGGGVVELANGANTFAGGIHIASGTLVVPSTVSDGNSPSALGTGRLPIALGPGTLRFSGDADTVRDLLFLPSSAKPKGASIVQVDDGARVRIFGRVSTAPDKKGNFIKRGPGTLVIATPYASTTNLIGVSGAEPGWVGVNTKPPAFSASGDGPEAGFEACNIADGRLEIATGNTVTNHFPSEVWVGMSSTSAANAETAGHLDIMSGVNIFDSLVVGRHNGTTTTAPGGLASTVNVYGGESTVLGGLNIAYGDDARFTHRPEVNVHGGSFTVNGTIRLDHNWSHGKITVDGGEMTVKGNINNQHYASGGSQLHIEVSNGGRFTSKATFNAALNSTVERKTVCRVSVKDGGVFAAKHVVSKANSDTQLYVDGGTFKSIQSVYADAVGFGAVYVGAKGMTLDVSQASSWGPKWISPIRSAPGVVDGGLDIVGKYGGDDLRWHGARVRLATDDIDLAGGVRVHKAGVSFGGGVFTVPFTLDGDSLIHTYGDTTLESLVATGRKLHLNYGYSGTDANAKLPLLTVRSFIPPHAEVTVGLFNGDGTTFTKIKGTFDILKFPATVGLGAKNLHVVNNSADAGYVFSERIEDGMKIISITVGDGTGTPSGDDPRKSGAWQSGVAPWCIGPWMYVYSGSSLTTASPLTLAVPHNRLAGISVPGDVNLTLAGGITEAAGGFLKTGTGTLSLAGDRGYSFGASFGSTVTHDTKLGDIALFDGSTNGAPSIAAHDSAFTVAAGTVAIGTGSDSPVVTVANGTLSVGSNTTAEPGAERDATLKMASGRLMAPTFVVGNNHGTPSTRANDMLVSSYVQNGGTTDVLRAKIGADATQVAAMSARFTLNGGLFRSRRHFYLGEKSTKSTEPLEVVFTQTGGRLEVGSDSFNMANYGTGTAEEGRLIGVSSGTADTTVNYTMTGGEVVFYRGFSFWNAGSKTINLNGGRIDTYGPFNGGNNTVLNWNGTVVAPHADQKGSPPSNFMRYFTKIISDTEAVVDMTYCASIDLAAAPSGMGRLVVRGANTNNVLRLPAQKYNLGGVTVEKGGMVIPLGNSGKDTAPAEILVRDGGGICDYYGNTIPSLTLGETSSDTVVLCGYDIHRGLSYLKTEKLTVNAGKVYVAWRDAVTHKLSLYGGSKEILRGPKGSIDAAKFAVHPEFAARGGSAQFSVKTDDAYDTLVINATVPVSTWTAGSSGAWADESNWDRVPAGSVHDTVCFPESLAADVRVDLGAGTHVWTVNQKSARAVTLAGALAFDGCPEYNITDPNGVLELAGRISAASTDASSKTLISRGTSKRGTLRITGEIADGLSVETRSGRIEGRPEAFGQAPLMLKNSTLRFTESGTCRASLSGSIPSDNKVEESGVAVDVPAGKTVFMTAAPDIAAPFAKVGSGTVVFRASGHIGSGYKNVNGAPWTAGSNGDLSCSPGFSVYSGRVVLDGGNAVFTSSPNGNNYGMAVGFRNVPDGTGGAYPAMLEITGGAQLDIGNAGLHIGCYANKSSTEQYDGPVKLGLTRRPYKAVNIRNGRLSVASLLLNYNNYSYQGCMVAELNVWDGGEFVVKSGRFAVCHDGDDVQLEEGPSVGVVNLHGGLIDHQGDKDVMVNYYNSNRKYHARGIINLFGGLFRTKPEYGFDLMRGIGHGSLNLCGGVLETGYILNTKANNKAIGDVHFDGGTFRPLQSGKEMKGWDSFTVGPGGAIFDLSRANALTLAQTLAATNGTSGGVRLVAGTNTAAVLTLAAVNTFEGPVEVNGGRLVPTVPGAVNSSTGVVVNAGGVFDANTYDFTFHSLGGDGGFYSNGVVTVTGVVAPSNTTFIVEDIVFADGAVLSCPVEGDVASGLKAPYLTVANSISKVGSAIIDLGLSGERLLPKFTSVKIAETAPGVVFPQMQIVNAGVAGSTSKLKRLVREDGVTEVYVNIVPKATAILVR